MEIITTILTDTVTGVSTVFERVTTTLYTTFYIDLRKVNREEYYRVHDILISRGYTSKVYREKR